MKKKQNSNFAVGYCRYSSDNQREESIEAQKRAILKYAQDNNISIIKWYVDEGFSATNDRRPQFQQMINDSKEKDFNLVLVHKFDRFSRNSNDFANYKFILKCNGVKLYSVLERIEDTPEGKILEGLLQGMAEYYSANLSRETMKGMKENAYKGMCCGGIPPYGYKRVPREVNGVIQYNKKGLPLHSTVIDPINAEAVKLMFNMTLEGKKRIEIIDKLNELGFKDYKNRPFKNTTSIDNVLRNERYTGVYIFNQYKKKITFNGISKELNEESEVIRIENGLPQIISKETYMNVQKILAQRVHKTPSNVKEKYLLSGKVVCGECGKHYQGWKKETKTAKHVYYKCLGNGRYTHSQEKEDYCNNTAIRRDDLEEFVVKEILKVLSCENIVDELFDKYNAYLKEQKSNSSLIDNLKKKIDNINSQIANVVNFIAQGQYVEIMTDKLQQLDNEKKEINAVLTNELEGLKEISISKEQLKIAISKAIEILKNKNASFEKRKLIVQTFLNKVVVYKNEVEIYINIIPANSCGDFSLEITNKDIASWGLKGGYAGLSGDNNLFIINNNINGGNEIENYNKKVAGMVTCNSSTGSPSRTRTYDLSV
ncbi:MAG: recombinase family protein [Clostridia bacterium]|jgi:site-specific DNA recombinase|nr:recombinase family protein [Clostridia bacterium]